MTALFAAEGRRGFHASSSTSLCALRGEKVVVTDTRAPFRRPANRIHGWGREAQRRGMAAELVKQERSGYVRVLTMQRPEKKNAFNNAMYQAMAQAVSAAQADPSVRVLLITGVGDAFCAGQDFSEMSADAGAEHAFPTFCPIS